jgi:hypothetical protein
MTSTTKTKREIVDFLWEWAQTQGDWAELLINKVVTSESELTTTERQEVYNYFLQSIGLNAGLPKVEIGKPNYSPTNKQIELISISEITGVNRLAKNQTIEFSKNLTIVFGENGTGKTGYSRILKSLGFSYDSNNIILSNVYGPVESKSAKLKYKANGVEDSFQWNGTNQNKELENISVFNSSCVQISLSDRQLIVSPIGFHLFNLVSSELNELAKVHDSKIKSHTISINWIDNLNMVTPQYAFIQGLSGLSSEQKLIELSNFTTAQEQVLKDKETELGNLNKTLLETEVQNMEASILELDIILNHIKSAQGLFSDVQWQLALSIKKQIKELESRTQIGIKDIALKHGIPFYNTDQFKSFITKAEEYIKLIDEPDNSKYPKDGDKCIYCLQPLEKPAFDLVESYRNLLNDHTQAELNKLKNAKTELSLQIFEIETNYVIHQNTFGIDTEKKPLQPAELIEYNEKLRELISIFYNDQIADGSIFTFDYPKYIKFISGKIDSLALIIKAKTDVIQNISTKEATLKYLIAELKDRKLLSGKVEELKTVINNHKAVTTLNSKTTVFNTYTLSKKTTEARDHLIKMNFETTFKSEIKDLRKSDIKIDLSFGTDKGNSKVIPRIKAHSLLEVLSEGEQKAIALAEFLTELQLDNIKAPVIFDDPVNSLDHNIIDDVARRLIKLSNERQVVIFTHSILLFNSILYFSKQPSYKDIIFKLYNSKNEYEVTGFISDAEENNAEENKFTEYIKNINKLLNNTPKDRPEVEVAEDCYGYLRSSIELFVEQIIFQNTIRRYQKNVALTQFVKVEGSLIDKHKDKLNEIFERSCGFIKGHSNPSVIQNDPKLIDLRSDFDEFNKIRDAFPKT